jgi:RNA polymerase sigma-70 factor (ECF subfamily)
MEALLECAQAGDADAFVAVRAHFEDSLMRYVTNYVRGDEVAAEDLVQETFLVAWRKLHQIQGPRHLRPWLYQVARYKAINHLRRRGPKGRPLRSLERLEAGSHEIPDPREDPLRRALRAEPGNPWVAALRRAIARLGRRHAAVVRLHYLRGLRTREVAELLGLTQTTVKMRLLRARKNLRKLVLEEMAGPGGPEAGGR